VQAFEASAKRAVKAGFDVIEIREYHYRKFENTETEMGSQIMLMGTSYTRP